MSKITHSASRPSEWYWHLNFAPSQPMFPLEAEQSVARSIQKYIFVFFPPKFPPNFPSKNA